MIHLFIGGPPGGLYGRHWSRWDFTVVYGSVVYVRAELTRTAKQLHDDLLEKCNVFYCLVPLLAQPLQCLVDLVAMKSHLCAARKFSSNLY